MTDAGAEAPKGADVIAGHVKTLPGKPGVYRMFDDKGNVLYVGKARNLKARVANYTRPTGHSNRIATMISLTAAMEFVTTATEAEALLLEANLIKKLKPRYNVLLRDDKSFPYILIARDHPVAQITKHRGARTRKGNYYGPFASAGAVNRTLNAMQKAFLVRSCNDSVYANRTRACLLYQIKRCSGPCVGLIEQAAYDGMVKEAEDFLAGKSQIIRAELSEQMQAASDALDFEQAARLRDRISALSFVSAQQGINPQGVDEADVFGVHQDAGQTSIQVFFIRSGQNWGTRSYFPRADKSLDAPDVLASFLMQFYDDKPIPKQILLSHEIAEMDLVGEALSAHAGYRVELFVPQRGEKAHLTQHALTNAREALARKLAESQSQAKLLEGVQRVFGLETPPQRIEIYDNSHIQGAHAVGAMVVAGPEGFIKNQYRKFNIRSEGASNDDFAMMREMLTRRFQRLLKAENEASDDEDGPAWPDLLLIDGGEGQLSAVRGVMRELGLEHVPVAGISKGPDRDAGREHFHMAGRPSFMLEARDPVLYYVQRLRDEAHRFAIGSHRAKRSKAISANPLDEIDGIGPSRKKALLHAFGSARAVARASIQDLMRVEGISKPLASAIHAHFHEGQE